MKKIVIMSLILLGIMPLRMSAADFALYVEDTTIAPGESALLSIQLDNNTDISGFQFQMMLPAGITCQSWNINELRMPLSARQGDLISMQRFDSGKLTVAGVLSCGAGASFSKSCGELATVTIMASPNMPLGTYTVELRDIDVCDPSGNDYDVPSTTFTLTVGTPSGMENLHNESGNAQVYDVQGRHQKEVSVGQTGIVNGRRVYRR